MRQDELRNFKMGTAGIAFVLGAASLIRGVWLAWQPAGWMVAGIFIAVPALFAAYDSFREK